MEDDREAVQVLMSERATGITLDCGLVGISRRFANRNRAAELKMKRPHSPLGHLADLLANR
jgi:hypothetical protein